MNILVYLLIVILGFTAANASITRELNYVEYTKCKYSAITGKYCTDKDEPTSQKGKVKISVTDDSLVTFFFNSKNTFVFKIKSVDETQNRHGDPVTVTIGKNKSDETFVLAIGDEFFNLIKTGLWGLYFTKPAHEVKDLSKYNFGSTKYNVRSIASCLYNKKTDDYTDSCEYNNLKEVLPIELKSRMRKGRLFVTIDTLPEIRIINVSETKTDENNNAWIFIGRDSENEDMVIAIGPDYFNYVTNDGEKISFSEGVFPDDLVKPQTYTGSGVAITSDILITNGHVIKGLSSLGIYQDEKKITTDGFDIIGELSDDILDLAILKVNGAKLNSCPLSTSEPKLGEDVLVYGYPQIQYQGTDLKVTKGIVSGKNGLRGDKKTFQIDAAIQHGNSGGPIVAKGKIIGLATAFLHDSQNVNFAIKASKIYQLLKFYDITPKSNTTDFTKCTYMLIGE